jgi:hypothetical protein
VLINQLLDSTHLAQLHRLHHFGFAVMLQAFKKSDKLEKIEQFLPIVMQLQSLKWYQWNQIKFKISV